MTAAAAARGGPPPPHGSPVNVASSLRPRDDRRPGERLLGGEWDAKRPKVIAALAAAYGRIFGERVLDLDFWNKARDQGVREVSRNFARVGLEMAPMYEDAMVTRISPSLASAGQMEEHVDLVKAHLTDYTRRFWDHIEYRQATDGNVHVAIKGPTGMGKSSCALTVANASSPIDPARVEEYVNLDIGRLSRKIRLKKPGEWVIQDELVQTSGEGSVTGKKLLENIEDTLRKSGVNVAILTPEGHEDETINCELEAIAWNRRAKWTAFTCRVRGTIQGTVALPWCPTALWAAYSKFKDKNVERTVAGAFRDKDFIAYNAMNLFEDAHVIGWLTVVVQKPKRTDFEDAVDRFGDAMLTTAQSADVAKWMYQAAGALPRIGDAQFPDYFGGYPPSQGLRSVSMALHKSG